MLRKTVFAVLVTAVIGLYFLLDMDTQALDYMQTKFQELQRFNHQRPLLTILLFFCIFALVNALLIPGSLPLMLLAGALFGMELGLPLSVLAGTTGSFIAFLTVRRFFIARLRRRYKKLWAFMDCRFRRNGVLYLLLLRISPGIPTNVISVCMGLTPISAQQFFCATLVGIIPWYAVYVSAGEMLTEITSVSDIVKMETIGWFAGAAILLLASLWLKERFGASQNGEHDAAE